MTRRGRSLAVEQSTKTEIFTSKPSLDASKIEFTKKKSRKNVVSFINNNSHSGGNSPPSSSALPQWQLSHAVSRSPANRNCSPAHRAAADQSEPPLHVGIVMEITRRTNGRAANWPESVDLVELRGFWAIRAEQGAAVPGASGAGSAVCEGSVSPVNQSNVGLNGSGGWRMCACADTHMDTGTHTHARRHTNTSSCA